LWVFGILDYLLPVHFDQGVSAVSPLHISSGPRFMLRVQVICLKPAYNRACTVVRYCLEGLLAMHGTSSRCTIMLWPKSTRLLFF